MRIGFDAPSVPDPRSRVPTPSTCVLLDVEGALTAPPTNDVRLVVPLTLGGGTLRHLGREFGGLS